MNISMPKHRNQSNGCRENHGNFVDGERARYSRARPSGRADVLLDLREMGCAKIPSKPWPTVKLR